MKTTAPVIGQKYRDWLTQFEGVCCYWVQEPDRQIVALVKDTGAAMLVPASRLEEVGAEQPAPEQEPKKAVKKTTPNPPAPKEAEPEPEPTPEPQKAVKKTRAKKAPEPDVMPDFGGDDGITLIDFREGVRKEMELAKTTDTQPLRAALEAFKARTLVDVPDGDRPKFLAAVRKAYEKEEN